VESADGEDSWSTIGISENLVNASWNALIDSVEYGLLRKEWRESASSI